MLDVPAISTAASNMGTVSTPVQAATGTAVRTAADTRLADTRMRRRGQRSTQVPAGRPIRNQGSQLAAVSRATVPVLACKTVIATNGTATVVIAEPNPLTDSPAHSRPKFRVRSRPPGRPFLAAVMCGGILVSRSPTELTVSPQPGMAAAFNGAVRPGEVVAPRSLVRRGFRMSRRTRSWYGSGHSPVFRA